MIDKLPQDGKAFPTTWASVAILAALIVALVVSYLDRQVLVLMVAPIKADLHIDDFRMSLLMGFAFAIFYSVFGIPIGRLADRVNRTRLIAVGVLLWSIATVLSGFAKSFGELFTFRVLIGVGEAVLSPAAYSLLGDSFPPRKLARATSIFALGATAGSGLALFLGGQVIDFVATWRNPFFGLDTLRPWQLTFILVGLPGFLVSGLMLLLAEPLRRRPARSNIAPSTDAFRHLWRHRFDYLPIYATAACSAVVIFGGLVWFPAHLMRAFGVDAKEVGLILGSISITGSALGAWLGVALTEYFIRHNRLDGHLRTVILTSLLTATAMTAPLMPTLIPACVMWFFAAVFGNAYYGVLAAALQIITPSNLRGTNSAVLLLFINIIGLGAGSALIGALAQYAFKGDRHAVGYSLASVGIAAALLAVLSARLGLSRYNLAAQSILRPY